MAAKEFFTEEGCFITELYGTPDDEAVSVARARVEPGVETALHTLTVEERWLVLEGRGLMTLGDAPPFEIGHGSSVRIPAGTPQGVFNPGPSDLIFLCVCTPRFVPAAYRELRPPSHRGF